MAPIALTIGVLLALVIALLAVPLTVVFSIHRIKETQGYVRFRWLFGLVRFQLRIPQATKAEPRPEPKAKKTAKSPRQRGEKGNTHGMLSLLKQPAFRRRVYIFLRDMLTATRAQNLFLRLRIGTGDPADTGRLWAIIGPIAGMAQNLRSAEVHIEPEFMDPLFEVESHGQFRLVPIQFIALTTVFMLSPTMLRACRRLRRGNAWMEALRAAKPLTIGDATLIAIERFGIQSDIGDAGYWLCGFKEAYAVVVCDASGIRALDADSAEIELDVLVQKIPNLGSLLSELSMSWSGCVDETIVGLYYEPLRERLRLLLRQGDRPQALIDVMAEFEREIDVFDCTGDDVALCFCLARRDSIPEWLNGSISPEIDNGAESSVAKVERSFMLKVGRVASYFGKVPLSVIRWYVFLLPKSGLFDYLQYATTWNRFLLSPVIWNCSDSTDLKMYIFFFPYSLFFNILVVDRSIA